MGIGEAIARDIWILIPLTIFSIPLVGVIGKAVVGPIAKAIAKIAEADKAALEASQRHLEHRFIELNARLDRIERQLGLALAEGETRRQFEAAQASVTAQAAIGAASGPPPLR
jgi:hypothetical protein